MARAQTPVGSTGRVTVVRQVRGDDGRWTSAPAGRLPKGARVRHRARATVRLSQTRAQSVERYGSTEAAARSALDDAVKSLVNPTATGEDLQPDTPLSAAAAVWLDTVNRRTNLPAGDRRRLSPSTADQYRRNLARYVSPSSLAPMPLHKVNRAPVLRAFLNGVADDHGEGAARSARSVLSGVLSLAVSDGALPGNACVGIVPMASERRESTRDSRRAFTPDEVASLLDHLSTDPEAIVTDVADVLVFMLGTGARISEALSQRWEDVDVEAGTVTIRGTKTASSVRTVPFQHDALRTALQRRLEHGGGEGLVFPVLGPQPSPGSPSKHSRGIRAAGATRDTSNVLSVIRRVLDGAGFPWATSHTCRRTVGTAVTEKYGSHAAAYVLGHATVATTERAYVDVRHRGALVAAGALN